MSQKYYLRSNTQAEPLVNNWYAWHLLINPVTYGLISKRLHMRIMESYIQAPQIHAETVKQNSMRGGPFADFSDDVQVEDIQRLHAQTKVKNAELFSLADAVQQLNDILLDNAGGNSLIPLYQEVPQPLKGFVELVYDLNNNPSFRLIEGLLYHSDYYTDSGQALLLSTVTQDDRPFVLSTPRLANDKQLALNVPFKDPVIDELFQSRHAGLGKQRLIELFEQHFEATEGNAKQFWSFFNDQPTEPTLPAVTDEKEVRVRYFGHACVMVQTAKVNILVDPLISYGYDSTIERYTLIDLPEKIDYVLLTHAHQDHVMFETLLQIRHKVDTVVVPKNNPGALQDTALKLMLQQIGFQNVVELGELDHIAIPNGEIVGLPFLGEHGDLNIASKIGYLIQTNNKKVMCVADSNNLEPLMYEHLRKLFSPVDVIFLGMECEGAPMSWLYGPLFVNKITRSMDQSRRLDGSDADKALGLIRAFDCKQVYVYAMGQEPWLSYITNIFYTDDSKPIIESNKLIEIGKQQGIAVERLYIKKDINLKSAVETN